MNFVTLRFVGALSRKGLFNKVYVDRVVTVIVAKREVSLGYCFWG